jgi:hypothetical protein
VVYLVFYVTLTKYKQLGALNIILLTLYRAPSGNFDHFLNRVETVHSPKAEFVICGDINVNYLMDSNRKLI